MDNSAQELQAFVQQFQATIDGMTQRLHSFETSMGTVLERQRADEGHAKGVEIELKQLQDQFNRLSGELTSLKNETHSSVQDLKRSIDDVKSSVDRLEGRINRSDFKLAA